MDPVPLWTSPTRRPEQFDHRPDAPVLAVVDEEHQAEPVLERARAAAQALSCPVTLVVVARRRWRRTVDPILLDKLRRAVPDLVPTSPLVVTSRRLGRRSTRRTWHAAETIARRNGVRLLVVPAYLAEVGSMDPPAPVVGVPTQRRGA